MKKKTQSNESNKRRVYSCRRSWFSQSDVIEICFRFQMNGFSHCQKVFESRSNSESALVSIINKTIATTITLTSTETEIRSGYSLFIVHLGKLRKNSLSINYEFNSTSKSTPNAKFTNPKITREKSKQF